MSIDFDAIMEDANKEKHLANKRRVALEEAECDTYVLKALGGKPIIICLCCGQMSWNHNDIAQVYCGFCNAFHDDWKHA